MRRSVFFPAAVAVPMYWCFALRNPFGHVSSVWILNSNGFGLGSGSAASFVFKNCPEIQKGQMQWRRYFKSPLLLGNMGVLTQEILEKAVSADKGSLNYDTFRDVDMEI
ncbi:hypothetical protein P8452_03566 [Trifolium repens]|nr:hypothetical protein P8452_03566 [Trifolium repens]